MTMTPHQCGSMFGGQARGHGTKEARKWGHSPQPGRSKRIIILGLAAFGLMAGVAVAAQGIGAVGQIPARGTIAEPFKVETDGLVELKTRPRSTSSIRRSRSGPTATPAGTAIQTRASTTIKSGTLTLYDGDDPDCTPHVYNAGSTFVDEGGGHVHIARNGTTRRPSKYR